MKSRRIFYSDVEQVKDLKNDKVYPVSGQDAEDLLDVKNFLVQREDGPRWYNVKRVKPCLT